MLVLRHHVHKKTFSPSACCLLLLLKYVAHPQTLSRDQRLAHPLLELSEGFGSTPGWIDFQFNAQPI